MGPCGTRSVQVWLEPLLPLPLGVAELLSHLNSPQSVLSSAGVELTDTVGVLLLVVVVVPPLPGVSLVINMGSCSPEKALTCSMPYDRKRSALHPPTSVGARTSA